MSKALIIHGFEASGQSNWFPWLSHELGARGFEVEVPDLPNSMSPDYDETMDFLRKLIVDFSTEDIVIGHSLGAFWAFKLAEEKEFSGLYLVAPAVGDLPYSSYRASWGSSDVNALENVLSHGVDFSKVRARQKVVWFGEDDPLIPLENSSLFTEDWKVIKERGYGHYTTFEFDGILGELG